MTLLGSIIIYFYKNAKYDGFIVNMLNTILVGKAQHSSMIVNCLVRLKQMINKTWSSVSNSSVLFVFDLKFRFYLVEGNKVNALFISKKLCLKKFCLGKKFGTNKRIMVQKIFFVWKKLGRKIMLSPKSILVPQKHFVKKILLVQKRLFGLKKWSQPLGLQFWQ